MNEHEKKEALKDIELCELFDEMKLDDQPNTYQNDIDGIDELVSKMEKITIDKP